MGTIQLPPDFKEFLKCLRDREVRFLLIGGYAANAFGYNRNTGNIDIWIEASAENQGRTIAAVRDFGFANVDATILEPADAMLRMGVPPLRIEVLKRISGVSFEDCWLRRVTTSDGDLQIPMISKDVLIVNKLATGRKGDLIDVERLS